MWIDPCLIKAAHLTPHSVCLVNQEDGFFSVERVFCLLKEAYVLSIQLVVVSHSV